MLDRFERINKRKTKAYLNLTKTPKKDFWFIAWSRAGVVQLYRDIADEHMALCHNDGSECPDGCG